MLKIKKGTEERMLSFYGDIEYYGVFMGYWLF